VLHAVPSPLHDGHGPVEVGLEVEVVDLALPAEAVGVHVDQVGALPQVRGDALEDEGRRGDRAAHPERGAGRLGRGGLAPAARPRDPRSPARAAEPGPRSTTSWSLLMRPTCGARWSPASVRTTRSTWSLPVRWRPSAYPIGTRPSRVRRSVLRMRP